MTKFLDVFKEKKEASPPLWFMRQAGRYLPEYREIRKNYQQFLDFCYSPQQVVEVTLQPIDRFDLDAAILFSDILVIPDALGQGVTFKESQGPLLSSLPLSSFRDTLSLDKLLTKLTPVYEAIHLTREKLHPSKTFLGFAGAPWTLALYMLEGEGTRDFAKAKKQAFDQEEKFSTFLDFLSQAIALHLIAQVKAGVQAIQLFDTWAGLCPASHFEKWVLEPTQKVLKAVKDVFPTLPIIGFPKGIGVQLVPYAEKTGVTGLSLDPSIPLSWATQELPHPIVLQGNLDPLLLVSGGASLKREIEAIHEKMKERPYIFNLGHGVLPQTPLRNVEDCVKWVRDLK